MSRPDSVLSAAAGGGAAGGDGVLVDAPAVALEEAKTEEELLQLDVDILREQLKELNVSGELRRKASPREERKWILIFSQRPLPVPWLPGGLRFGDRAQDAEFQNIISNEISYTIVLVELTMPLSPSLFVSLPLPVFSSFPSCPFPLDPSCVCFALCVSRGWHLALARTGRPRQEAACGATVQCEDAGRGRGGRRRFRRRH